MNSKTDTLRPLSFHSANYALWKEAPLAGSSVKLWAKGIPSDNTLRPLSFHCASNAHWNEAPLAGTSLWSARIAASQAHTPKTKAKTATPQPMAKQPHRPCAKNSKPKTPGPANTCNNSSHTHTAHTNQSRVHAHTCPLATSWLSRRHPVEWLT